MLRVHCMGSNPSSLTFISKLVVLYPSHNDWLNHLNHPLLSVMLVVFVKWPNQKVAKRARAWKFQHKVFSRAVMLKYWVADRPTPLCIQLQQSPTLGSIDLECNPTGIQPIFETLKYAFIAMRKASFRDSFSRQLFAGIDASHGPKSNSRHNIH